jgi:hypothetical protein
MEAGVIIGSAIFEVNPFGPVHANRKPVRFVADRFSEPPTQIGELPDTDKLPSELPTTTEAVLVIAPQAGVVTVTV